MTFTNWACSPENVASLKKIQHLIRDFDLFEISEDGYFSWKYLNEVMGFQQEISKQRVGVSSKGGKAGRKIAAKSPRDMSAEASKKECFLHQETMKTA